MIKWENCAKWHVLLFLSSRSLMVWKYAWYYAISRDWMLDLCLKLLRCPLAHQPSLNEVIIRHYLRHLVLYFYRMLECNFLKVLKRSNQITLVHNLVGPVVYQTGSRPHLDKKWLYHKQRQSLNLGDFCFWVLVYLWLTWSLEILFYPTVFKMAYYGKKNYLL